MLKLKTGKVGGQCCLKSQTIPTAISDKYRTIIHHSTARQMEWVFNALTYKLQNLSDVNTDIFKRRLGIWLDTPKIDGYGATVPTELDSIVDQCMPDGDPICG